MSRGEPWVFPAKALRVVRGDTFDAILDLGFGISTTRRLELLAAVCPPKDTEAGVKAFSFASVWLDGRDLEVETVKCEGAPGRWLAEVTDAASGESLATELLKRGLAQTVEAATAAATAGGR